MSGRRLSFGVLSLVAVFAIMVGCGPGGAPAAPAASNPPAPAAQAPAQPPAPAPAAQAPAPAAPAAPAPAAPATSQAPAAPAAAPPATKNRVEGGTFTVGMVADVVTLDPPMITDVYSGYVSTQIHETLFTTDFNARLQPNLAQSVEQVDDTTYIFKLRQGVKFHNGEELTSDDVVFTWRRVFDPATKSPRIGMLSDAIAGPEQITAVDKYTVKVALKAPFAPFLDRAAHNSLAILNRKAVEAAGANYSQKPVGTGPFKFVSWATGDRAIVEKNNDYWGPKPALDKLIFRPIPDTNTRMIELESGGIDYMMTLPVGEIERLKQEGKVQVQVEPAINISFLAFNMQKPPFADNQKLRQAIAYAIDRDEINNAIFFGIGFPAISPLNPSNWAFNPSVPRYDFDAAKAKQLYQESGYSGAPIELAVNDSTETRQQAERMQAQIKEVLGLDITIKVMEWGGFLGYIREGSHQMTALGWNGASDPDSVLYSEFHSKNWGGAGNLSFYKNEQVDDLLARAQTVKDQEERKKLYFQAQEIIMTEMPFKTLRHGVQSAGLRPTVREFTLHPLGRQLFLGTWLDKK